MFRVGRRHTLKIAHCSQFGNKSILASTTSGSTSDWQAPPTNMATSESNKWYLYENDIYGVNGLMDFPSKKDLVDYVLSADFLENRISKEIDEAGREDLQDACEKYMAGTIEAYDYTDQVLENLADYECEIDSMTIEDFESLRSGKSTFSQETIAMFCSRQEDI